MKTWRNPLGLIAAPLIVGAVTAMQQTSGTADVVKLELPDYWVPYQAEFRVYLPDGEKHSTRYRGSDGSTANYDVDHDIVTIHNVRSGRTFAGSLAKNEWTSYKLAPAAVGTLDREFNVRREALKVSDETVQGLTVYEVKGTSGSLALMVPGLNNLPLRAFDKTGKLLAEYTNIRLSVPDDRVFSPPSGAKITVKDELLLPSKMLALTKKEPEQPRKQQ